MEDREGDQTEHEFFVNAGADRQYDHPAPVGRRGSRQIAKSDDPNRQKRDAEEDAGEGDDVDDETPKAKKPRGRKAKAKKDETVEAEVEEEDSEKVKEEVLDEDM